MTGMQAPRLVQSNVPMNALTAAAPHLSPAAMKTARANTAKPAAKAVMTGMQAPRLVQNNARRCPATAIAVVSGQEPNLTAAAGRERFVMFRI